MRIIITGGAGFTGSNLIRSLLQQSDICILNIDKLIFPVCYHSIKEFDSLPQSRYSFSQTDICEYAKLNHLFSRFKPDAVKYKQHAGERLGLL